MLNFIGQSTFFLNIDKHSIDKKDWLILKFLWKWWFSNLWKNKCEIIIYLIYFIKVCFINKINNLIISLIKIF